MADMWPKGVGRPLVVVALLVVLLVSGCTDSSYPEDLAYPQRSDPLVLFKRDVSIEPDFPDPPGKLDEHIRQIGTTVDKNEAELLDVSTIRPEFRAPIRALLETCFGTPAHPRVDVPPEFAGRPALRDAVDRLRLDETMLADGSKLYRRHCLHCHGLAGDGRGASGAWLNPHPRDYREGLFKFISTDIGNANTRPSRDDLFRTVQRGIEGTAMPSFITLSSDELHALVSYVMHLSLRGEVEFMLLRDADKKQKALFGPNNDRQVSADEVGQRIREWVRTDSEGDGFFNLVANRVEQWNLSSRKMIAPTVPRTEPTEESIRKGYRLVDDAGCLKCHIDYGRQSHFKYDQWGTLVRPANWTAGVYRGGRRPIDMFWRIKAGIPPSNMPKAESKYTDADVWDIVNFLQALPYPHMLPTDARKGGNLRARIYAEDRVAKTE